MKNLLCLIVCFGFLVCGTYALGKDVSSYLQDISVTIKTKGGEGSGVVFTREVFSSTGNKKVNFVFSILTIRFQQN